MIVKIAIAGTTGITRINEEITAESKEKTLVFDQVSHPEIAFLAENGLQHANIDLSLFTIASAIFLTKAGGRAYLQPSEKKVLVYDNPMTNPVGTVDINFEAKDGKIKWVLEPVQDFFSMRAMNDR